MIEATREGMIGEDVIASGVSEEEYMEKYAAHFCEWVDGKVIGLSPVVDKHDMLSRYLAMMFEAYFSLHPVGVIRQAPFVMCLFHRREPDVQVILEENPHELRATYMDGPADICIEIVSDESVVRDYGQKFKEYEQGGVREYWIIDPTRQDARFYKRNEDYLFISMSTERQIFHSHNTQRCYLAHTYIVARATAQYVAGC